jgi:hypothetical protein
MVEIARVLHPSGAALILTPRRRGRPTEEDPNASIGERVERFGQDDHVRLYGDDLETRLGNAGLRTARLDFAEILDPRVERLIGVTTAEEAWVATVAKDPSTIVAGDDLVDVLFESMLSEMEALRRDRNRATAEAEEWRRHYDWLNRRPLVRMARRLKRLVSSDRGPTS